MSKGRYVPPPIIFAQPRAGDPSQKVDADYFKAHPGVREYTRHYIAGETLDPMHPDTWVYVKMMGVERVRGFAPPAVKRNN